MGFDDGAVVVKMGREEPAVSMDGTGKLVWARHNEVVSAIVKGGDASIKDGAPIALPSKDMGTTEMYVYLPSVSYQRTNASIATQLLYHILPTADSSAFVETANSSS